MNPIDKAQDSAQRFLEEALEQQRRKATTESKSHGRCLYCNAVLSNPKARFCPPDEGLTCREDFEMEQRISYIKGGSR